MEENKAAKSHDKGISQILPHEKRSWPGIAFIWVGTMICIPMLMVGGLPLHQIGDRRLTRAGQADDHKAISHHDLVTSWARNPRPS